LKKLKIGNAQGFWGDSPGAAAHLLSQQPDLDYITLDYLAEVSMSIMAIQREKDPSCGFAKDFLDVIQSLIPYWKNGSNVKIVTNAGGLNPLACAKACLEILKKNGCVKKLGVIYGDDVLEIIKSSPKDQKNYNNLESGESITTVINKLMTANAYLGGKAIAEALQKGAEIVVTGRTADPSLTVGPAVSYFGWKWDEWDRIAGATVAGHLIECGTQVTGGIYTNWMELPDLANIGFPFVEIDEDGSCVVTKPSHTGGKVNKEIVKEQLLYELGDPERYLSPDATVSFLKLRLNEDGENRIKVSGAVGSCPPKTYKVSATYHDGYKSEGMLTIFGSHAVRKARMCGEIVLKKVMNAGFDLERAQIECLGSNDSISAIKDNMYQVCNEADLQECVLRICVADQRKEALEYFGKEIAPLVTSGPQGVTGYTSGRPVIRQVFGYWPCIIDCSLVKYHVELIS
jgi:Acyclic terpene utilisation family protein AtuA